MTFEIIHKQVMFLNISPELLFLILFLIGCLTLALILSYLIDDN